MVSHAVKLNGLVTWPNCGLGLTVQKINFINLQKYDSGLALSSAYSAKFRRVPARNGAEFADRRGSEAKNTIFSRFSTPQNSARPSAA